MSVVLYEYQKPLVKETIDNLGNVPVVLAAGPGNGKTEMAISICEHFLNENPNIRILILAHGTTALRTNFARRLEKYLPGKYQEVKNLSEIDDSIPITVAIPHAFKSDKTVKFDLLIVDEAHEFYFAEKLGKEIRQRINPKMELLLTGSPFVFTYEIKKAYEENKPAPFHKVSMTVNELIEMDPKKLAKLRAVVCQSCYDFTKDNFNNSGELYDEYSFDKVQTENTVFKVVDAILTILNPYPSRIPRLGKTMFACHNVNQAIQVYTYLKQIGVRVAISVSKKESDFELLKDIEYGDDQIDKFTLNPDIQALVVVKKAVLGFNYTELVNVIDMTGSQNLSRIFQLMHRAVRAFESPNQQEKEKLFIKIGPHGHGGHEQTVHIMTAVICLNDRRWYDGFNGKNFLTLPIPRPRGPGITGVGSQEGADSETDVVTEPRDRKPTIYLDVPASDLLFEGTQDVFLKNPAAKIGYTTLGMAREKLMGINAQVDWKTIPKSAIREALIRIQRGQSSGLEEYGYNE